MLFDTDVIIRIQRGNPKAADAADEDTERFISVVTYMELLQNAQNKQQQTTIKNYLKELDFAILPLSESIGHRALIYIEEYSMSHGISAGDALIAATAIENDLSLISGNHKHYKAIRELQFKHFSP